MVTTQEWKFLSKGVKTGVPFAQREHKLISLKWKKHTLNTVEPSVQTP